MKRYTYFLLFLLGWLQRCGSPPLSPKIEVLESPTETLLQAISIVDGQTIWVSGHGGSFLLTEDGGQTWNLFQHPTGDTLQFRDIHAFNENKAILMSAGQGPRSRIFTFFDGSWDENFFMNDSLGFLDCISFWDAQRGLAYGDAIDEYPYILTTGNGGKSWERIPLDNLPKAGKGEGGFAASGTCATTGEEGKAWIATGAGGHCRVLFTEDYGKSWKAVPSPIVKGEVAGNTSVSFIGEVGFLVGGDLLKTDTYTNNGAFSLDGGKSWALGNKPVTKGAFYGGAITEVGDQTFAFACGPNGLDFTNDLGRSWKNLDTLNYWAVEMKGGIGFVAGKNGRLLKITLQ